MQRTLILFVSLYKSKIISSSHPIVLSLLPHLTFSNDGSTPILMAASEGHLEIVRTLGEAVGRKGARAANDEGLTPRMAAAGNGHAKVEKLLAQLESHQSLAKNLDTGLGCVPKA